MTSQFSKKARLGQHASRTCLRFGQTLYSFRVLISVWRRLIFAARWLTPKCSKRKTSSPLQDYADIQRGMAQISGEIERGEFQWLLDLEDVHLNIEKRLTEAGW